MAIDYSDYEFLKVEVADRIATLTINRPDRLNAVNGPLHHELEQIWIDLGADSDVNAIIFTGAGRAFCAGGDVKGMAEGGFAGSEGAKKGKGRGRGAIQAANGRRLVENMLDVEQPIIGAINGDAVGLGATLALLCDITVVSEKARFADTHVKVGVVAGDGGAVIWPLLIGPHRAKEFLMRGNFIDGARGRTNRDGKLCGRARAGDGEIKRTGAGAGRRADLGDPMEQAGRQQMAQGAG